ncbi:MAG: FAD-dependent oxidoreductase [Geminicoccaceae bacterium]
MPTWAWRDSILEAAERILSRVVPPAIADVVYDLHQAESVQIRCCAQIEHVATAGEMIEVTLADGMRLPADMVIGGIGAIPETTLADAAGVAVNDGIIVNASLQTSHPDIFAAGHDASLPEKLG